MGCGYGSSLPWLKWEVEQIVRTMYSIILMVRGSEMAKIKRWNTDDPEVRKMVEAVKWELANEMGIEVPRDGYWGNTPSKDLGKIGSQLQKRVALLLECLQKKEPAKEKKEGKPGTKPQRKAKKK